MMAWRSTASLVAWLVCAAVAGADPMSPPQEGSDRKGGDFHRFAATDVAVCAAGCAEDANCRAYTYVEETGACFLKHFAPPAEDNDCCTSGVKIMGREEIGFDRQGSNLGQGRPADTVGTCETACAANAECRAYTWVKPGVQDGGAICWLKSAPAPRFRSDCCVSGFRLRIPSEVELQRP